MQIKQDEGIFEGLIVHELVNGSIILQNPDFLNDLHREIADNPSLSTI